VTGKVWLLEYLLNGVIDFDDDVVVLHARGIGLASPPFGTWFLDPARFD